MFAAAEINSTPKAGASAAAAEGAEDEAAVMGSPPEEGDWGRYLQLERYEQLRLIALSINTRRTVDEAELALNSEAIELVSALLSCTAR